MKAILINDCLMQPLLMSLDAQEGGGRGILLYIIYIGMCCCRRYGF